MTAPIGLTIKTKIEDMAIGDCIPCRYKATSGVAGTFSELGTCVATEIPVVGTATPDGLFYFIKSDSGLLIADRVVQTSVSWDVLNTAKYIQGSHFLIAQNNYIQTIIGTDTYNASTPNKAIDRVYGYTNSGDTLPLWNNGWVSWNSDKTKIATLTIQFSSSKIINVIDLQVAQVFAVTTGSTTTKNFKVYGSNDGTDRILLYTGQQQNNTGIARHSFNNTASYIYYIIDIIDNWATIDSLKCYKGISEIAFFRDASYLIRSLTGGVSYLSATGGSSITDQGLGAWPESDEWDSYIRKSTLGGKATADNNNIWNWSGAMSWAQDTPINGLLVPSASSATSAMRITRPFPLASSRNINAMNSNATGSNLGFRPVLEYLENAKQTNLWY